MVGRIMECVFRFWSVSIIIDVLGSFKLFCPWVGILCLAADASPAVRCKYNSCTTILWKQLIVMLVDMTGVWPLGQHEYCSFNLFKCSIARSPCGAAAALSTCTDVHAMCTDLTIFIILNSLRHIMIWNRTSGVGFEHFHSWWAKASIVNFFCHAWVP